MRNQYFLLRHGQVIYRNHKETIIYPSPKWLYPSLKEQGKIRLTAAAEKKFKKLAKKIKKEKIDLIYSSDILRTRQTAGIIAKELGLKINFDKRLRDVAHGVYQGKTKKEFYHVFPDPRKRFIAKPKGGESWNDVKKRVVSFIKDIEKKHKNKKILIVSHGDVLWLLEGIIKQMTRQELLDETFIKKNFIKPGEFRKL